MYRVTPRMTPPPPPPPPPLPTLESGPPRRWLRSFSSRRHLARRLLNHTCLFILFIKYLFFFCQSKNTCAYAQLLPFFILNRLQQHAHKCHPITIKYWTVCSILWKSFNFHHKKNEWEFVPECEPRVGLSFQRVARGQTHPDSECVQILIILDLDLRVNNFVLKLFYSNEIVNWPYLFKTLDLLVGERGAVALQFAFEAQSHLRIFISRRIVFGIAIGYVAIVAILSQ